MIRKKSLSIQIYGVILQIYGVINSKPGRAYYGKTNIFASQESPSGTPGLTELMRLKIRVNAFIWLPITSQNYLAISSNLNKNTYLL